MLKQSLHRHIFTFAVSVALLAYCGWANADPPSRVGRLGYMTGGVSFSPAGENDWVQASMNRPLTTGDRLWTESRARTEIQLGGAMVRMGADTSVSILNLDNRIVQLQLTQGTLNVRVRRLAANQVFEVNTPNLAFTLRQAGEYRITVDPGGNATTIIVRKGRGEVYGEGAAYVLDSRQSYRFTGTGLRDYRYVNAPRLDEFDRWSSERDRRYDNSGSARYVSQDVIGYQDLDANGTWRADVTFGNVWYPNRISSGWAPYRDGHWAWVDPWGWTWIDDAPWGFAVSHYGRWANLRGAWAWVPGPVRSQAYYAPALVVFVGGNNFQLSLSSGNVGGVGWFPLGPREVYRPSYTVSRGYFENINISNTVVNTTVVNNYYNNSNVTNVVYANREVAGAIIAVPTTAFVQSQPVSRAAVRVSREMVASAPLAVIPAIAPTERSVRGGASPSDRSPPARVFERPVVARTQPPAVQASFAAQQQQLTATPGKPLDDAARKELRPAAAAAAPVVKVVTPTQAATPTLQPPPTASDTIPADARGKPEQRGNNQQRDQRGNAEQRQQPIAPVEPAAPPQRAAEPRAVAPPAAQPTPAAPPAPTAQPPEQRGRSEQRGNAEQRQQPIAPVAPAAPPQREAEPRAVAPPAAQPAPAAPPAPTAQPPEQRGRSEQRGNAEQRQQAPVAPAAPPQRAAEPRAVAPPAAQPVPVAPPAPAAEQPARPERKAPPAARQAEPPAPAPTPAPAPAAARQPAPQPQAAQPKPNADKGKGQARDKATTEEELRLEEEELLRKRKNNK